MPGWAPSPSATSSRWPTCARALQGRSAPLKSFLLDQRRIAGVGNIYADEALFRARLHPLRAAGSVGPREAQRLHAALLETLQAGIDHEGSSIESFVDPAGVRGSFQQILNVYQRTGEPCRVCGTTVRRTVVGGRGTHFCPHCQPRRGGMAPSARRRPSSDVAGARQGARLRGAGRSPARDAPDAAVNELYVVVAWAPRGEQRRGGGARHLAVARGWYAYVGSAARAREARVARHLAADKPLRWHADYFFTALPGARGMARRYGALCECELADGLAAAARRGAPPAALRRRRLPLRRPPGASGPAPAPLRPAPRGRRRRGGAGLQPPPPRLGTHNQPLLGTRTHALWVRAPGTSV